MSFLNAQCNKCEHREDIRESISFICKLHDKMYEVDQNDCSDYESFEEDEKASYECD